jgi:hypoxanthine phosphoribosyltransferase
MTEDIEHIKQVRRDADCLFTEKDIDAALSSLASEITERYAESNPLILCVMNGGMIPCGHLVTRFDFPLQLDYIHASRYRGQTSGSDLHWLAGPHVPLRDRVVIIVDDILDEGLTLKAIIDWCNNEGAREVSTAVLVEKLHERKHGVKQADFVGLQVEDRYVFGYGLDYHGYLRNVNGIYAVKNG